MLSDAELASLSDNEKRAYAEYLIKRQRAERHGTALLASIANALADPRGQGRVHAERLRNWVREIIKTELAGVSDQ